MTTVKIHYAIVMKAIKNTSFSTPITVTTTKQQKENRRRKHSNNEYEQKDHIIHNTQIVQQSYTIIQ